MGDIWDGGVAVYGAGHQWIRFKPLRETVVQPRT
jgi:hypothetical protein